MKLRLPAPLLWLFLVSFLVTLALAYRGTGSPSTVSAWTPWQRAPTGGVASTAAVRKDIPAASVDHEAAVADTASSPGSTHDEFAPEIEAAITAEDSNQRAAAIASLSRAPAIEALAALEQVLRTDGDAGNRSMAMQILLQLPDNATVRGSLLPLLREFMADADMHIAALAREGYERMRTTADRNAA
jgi:hypothetical protein